MLFKNKSLQSVVSLFVKEIILNYADRANNADYDK